MLRPSGRFGFTVWAAPAQSKGFEIIYGAVQRHGSFDVDLPPGPNFFLYADAEKSTESLTAAGFEAVTHTTVPQIWEPDHRSRSDRRRLGETRGHGGTSKRFARVSTGSASASRRRGDSTNGARGPASSGMSSRGNGYAHDRDREPAPSSARLILALAVDIDLSVEPSQVSRRPGAAWYWA